MSEFLFNLGRRCAQHPFRVLGIWLASAAMVFGIQAAVGGPLNNNFRVPGVESQTAADILTARFPARAGASGRVIFHSTKVPLTDSRARTAIHDTRRALAAGADVVAVSDPFNPQAGALSPDRRTAYVDVNYSVQTLKAAHATDAQRAVAIARHDGLQAEIGGSIMNAKQGASGSEGFGVLVAIIVLLVAFGSAMAMGIPIATAFVGILVGSAGMGILAGLTDVPSVSGMLGMMIGLGVGIDYALFVVTRHRQHLRDGATVADAAGVANATAGKAVLFAGGTVVIAILGLVVAGLPAVTIMGVAIAIIVVVAMAAAVTLLPALLGLVGTKIDKLSIHRRSHLTTPSHQTLSGRWAHHVGLHPVRYAAMSLLVLCAIALPVFHMRIGLADDSNAAPSSTQRRAYGLLVSSFGKGFNGPIVAVVQTPTAGDRVAVARLHEALESDRGVAAVSPPQFNRAGDTAVLKVEPTTSPQDAATDELVRHLRADVLPAAMRGTGAHASLTGRAMITDLTERISARLPFFIGAVVALSFVLLMIVFRSVLVPFKAALLNLLSIGAAYGVVVAVFQWGWAKNLIGLDNTIPVNPFVPMMMFAILFGLSMDYEVFLLSRVREEFVRSGDSHTSVVDGLSTTARVITSAALIMISVFGAFIPGDNVTIKMFGVGLAVAVLIDATLVRLVLVPATMSLLGSANWWLPRWLDRLLPDLDLDGRVAVEGPSVDECEPALDAA
ncbi:MAG: MMPL family transporter [Frankiaceae bacterium]|nr:MMPL family transporter [Frankiaceae bacterium]